VELDAGTKVSDGAWSSPVRQWRGDSPAGRRHTKAPASAKGSSGGWGTAWSGATRDGCAARWQGGGWMAR
jgi:hypothetical protein